MRVLFVDVGQGTCQVILTGDRKAIVIDTGSHPRTVMRTLRLFRIETIELLCVSHNHVDHAGGAAYKKKQKRTKKKHKGKQQPSTTMGILAHYQDAIERIAFVPDLDLAKSQFGKALAQLVKDGKLLSENIEPITRKTKPEILWDRGETALTVLSPMGGTVVGAMVGNNANASSAILELRHRGDRIVFAADSEYQQWRDILRLRKNRVLKCHAITLPHHGGLMHGSQADLQWFTSAAVQAEVVVVSVGTRNGHEHPRPEPIQTMAATGAHVICTQITERCCADLESCRPGVMGVPRYPCRSSSTKDVKKKKTKGGGTIERSHNVACASTIFARATEAGFEFDRLSAHREGVDRLVEAGHAPLCRARTRLSGTA